jgi:hypothetical protein
MRVKFTNTLFNEVIFGTIIEMMTAEVFVIQADKGGRYIVNPNSDYNFGFELNAEGEQRYKAGWDALIEKIEKADRVKQER